MATQTGSYDFKAAKEARDNAAKQATNFLSSDNSGIMVYDGENGDQTPSNPSANTRNVFIDDNSVDIRLGSTALASFGETVIVGKQNDTHMVLSPTQFTAKKGEATYYDINMIDNDAIAYAYYKDLLSAGSRSGWSETTDVTLDVPSGGAHNNSIQLQMYTAAYKTGTHYYTLKYAHNLTIGQAAHIVVTYSAASGKTPEQHLYYDYDGVNTVTVSAENMDSDTLYRLKLYVAITTQSPSVSFGLNTRGYGANSLGSGESVIHNGANSLVTGKYNIEDEEDEYAFIVGNGENEVNRSNGFTVDWDGHTTIGGHTSRIGTIVDGNVRESLALANGTAKYLAAITLDAGTWIVFGRVGFPAGANARRLNISATQDASTIETQVIATSAAQTHLTHTKAVEVTSDNTKYYLNAYQNSGSTITATNVDLYAVRIC